MNDLIFEDREVFNMDLLNVYRECQRMELPSGTGYVFRSLCFYRKLLENANIEHPFEVYDEHWKMMYDGQLAEVNPKPVGVCNPDRNV